MADRDAQYDPYIPSGGAPAAGTAQAAPGNQRTAALQAVSSINPISPMQSMEFGSFLDHPDQDATPLYRMDALRRPFFWRSIATVRRRATTLAIMFTRASVTSFEVAMFGSIGHRMWTHPAPPGDERDELRSRMLRLQSVHDTA
jgi:hypothetical protein